MLSKIGMFLKFSKILIDNKNICLESSKDPLWKSLLLPIKEVPQSSKFKLIAYNFAFHQKLESFQYKAVLVVTSAMRENCKEIR